MKVEIQKAPNGQFELKVQCSEFGKAATAGLLTRRYRADSLDDLLAVSVSELRSDGDVGGKYALLQKVWDTVFDAQDEAVRQQKQS